MWADLQHLSDAELVDAVRRGESEAFDVLFRRHYAAACEYAARFAGPDHAPDCVAEGFSRVYRVLLKGLGPDSNFRGYLYTAVRNAHVDTIRRGRGEVPVDDLGIDIPSSDDVEDDVLSRFDAAPIRRAFGRLRPAWRTVLWHTAVLGESHEQVARRLDTNPNAVAVLSFRAREGLRQAYLAEHVSSSDDKACGRVASHLPRYVRGQLTAKREQVVDEHVESCPACRAAVADLAQINGNLGAVLTPAVLLLTPGLVSGATAKGALAGVLAWLPGRAKEVAGVAVAATAAVVVGVTLTSGSEAEPRPTSAPEPSAKAPPTRDPLPPPTESTDRPASRESPSATPTPPPRTSESPPLDTVAAPPPLSVESPAPPPQSPPSPPTSTPPSPPPSSVTQTRVAAFGSDLLRQGLVEFDVTPAAADEIVVRASNARILVAASNGATCSLGWPGGGEAMVTCAVRDGHPSTFRLSLHVNFADATVPVTGRVELTGASEAVMADFAIAP